MFDRLTNIPIKKIPTHFVLLFAGLALIVAGCDSVGQQQKETETENEIGEKISYTITNDVADRLSTVDGNSSSSAMTTPAKDHAINFEPTHRVDPPSIPGVSDPVRASHMVLSSPPASGAPRLYVGYKVTGSEAGGGIDVLDAPPTGPLTALSGADINALVTENVDIQELALRENINDDPVGLLAATDTDLDFQLRPQLHGIEVASGNGTPKPIDGDGSTVAYEFETLEHPSLLPTEANADDLPKIAKSVVDEPSTSTTYVVSDEGTLHAFDTGANARDIEDRQEDVVLESGTQFRSVALGPGPGEVFVLTFDGRVLEYEFSGSSFSGPVKSATLGDPVGTTSDGGDAEEAIARLTSYSPPSGGHYVIAALGTNGFHVLRTDAPGLGSVFSNSDVDTEVSTPSVTGAGDYLYAANGDGIAIFHVLDSGAGGFAAEYVARESIADLVPPGTSLDGGQVNHIIADHNATGDIVLYVAKSTDGVWRFEEIPSNPYS